MPTSQRVKELAFQVGFDLCGICSPEILPEARAQFTRWLELGYHGEMDYLAKEPERRTEPRRILATSQAVIMLGLNYYQPDTQPPTRGMGRVSRYARGRDYHKVISSRLRQLVKLLTAEAADAQFRWFVDFGPFMERVYAERAGLGYLGRNGLLINRQFGSWIFLSEIITDLPLAFDDPSLVNHGRCGSCRRCVEACPTGAIVEDRTVDARRCISYLTIERPSDIPLPLARLMGDRIFGCDICQDVCPHNGRAKTTEHIAFLPPHGVGELLDARHVLTLTSREQFLALTAGTPLTRPRMEGLKRNAEVVMNNMADVKGSE